MNVGQYRRAREQANELAAHLTTDDAELFNGWFKLFLDQLMRDESEVDHYHLNKNIAVQKAWDDKHGQYSYRALLETIRSDMEN